MSKRSVTDSSRATTESVELHDYHSMETHTVASRNSSKHLQPQAIDQTPQQNNLQASENVGATASFVSGQAYGFQNSTFTDTATNGIPITTEFKPGTIVEIFKSRMLGVIINSVDVAGEIQYRVDTGVHEQLTTGILSDTNSGSSAIVQRSDINADIAFSALNMNTLRRYRRQITGINKLSDHHSYQNLFNVIRQAAIMTKNKAALNSHLLMQTSYEDVVSRSLMQGEVIQPVVEGTTNYLHYHFIRSSPSGFVHTKPGRVYVTNKRLLFISLVMKNQPELHRVHQTFRGMVAASEPGPNKEEWAYNIKYTNHFNLEMNDIYFTEVVHSTTSAMTTAEVTTGISPASSCCCQRYFSALCCHCLCLKEWQINRYPTERCESSRLIQLRTLVSPWDPNYLIDRPVFGSVQLILNNSTPLPYVLNFMNLVKQQSIHQVSPPEIVNATRPYYLQIANEVMDRRKSNYIPVPNKDGSMEPMQMPNGSRAVYLPNKQQGICSCAVM